MDLGLRDRACLVTGSTDGIGLATARLLVEEGGRVVTCGRTEAPGIGEVHHVQADLGMAGYDEAHFYRRNSAAGGAIRRRTCSGDPTRVSAAGGDGIDSWE